jgi:hypothetical protein
MNSDRMRLLLTHPRNGRSMPLSVTVLLQTDNRFHSRDYYIHLEYIKLFSVHYLKQTATKLGLETTSIIDPAQIVILRKLP